MARPKLKAGEKGRYHVSRLEKEKVNARKSLKASTSKQQRDLKRLAKAKEKQKNSKQGLKLAGSGGTTTEDFVKTLPKDIRRQHRSHL